MPQMKPLLWLYLYLIFSLIILIFNILNYFVFIQKIKFKNFLNKKSIKYLIWKW